MGSFSPDWWDLVPATLGALIGAAAAAYPAYRLAKHASAEVLRRDNEQRRADERASAYSLFSKLLLLTNSVLTIELQLSQMESRIAEQDTPLSRRISVLTGLGGTEIISFEPNDFSILIAANNAQFINDLQLLQRQQFAICSSLEAYGSRKTQLQDYLDELQSDQTEHGAIRFKLTAEQASKVSNKEAHLEALIVPLLALVQTSAGLARKVAEEFNATMQRHFQGEKFPTIAP